MNELMISAVSVCAPLGVAAIGELHSERAGLLNLSVEGNMVLGAVVAWLVAHATGSTALGCATALAAGGVAGCVLWLLTDVLEIPQHVGGLGIGFSCSGIALTIYRNAPATYKSTSLPFTGLEAPVLACSCAALLIGLVASHFWFGPSRLGRSLTLLGLDMRSADLKGLPIRWLRLGLAAATVSCAFLAGAMLSTLVVRNFNVGLISGRGWVVLCLVILAEWKFLRLVGILIVWTGLELLRWSGQFWNLDIPSPLILMLPFLGGLIVVSLAKARAHAPPHARQDLRASRGCSLTSNHPSPTVFIIGPFTRALSAGREFDTHVRRRLEFLHHHLERRSCTLISAHRIEAWGECLETPGRLARRDLDAVRECDLIVGYWGSIHSFGMLIELGVALTVGVPTLIVCEPQASIPSDLYRGIVQLQLIREATWHSDDHVARELDLFLSSR